MLVTRLLIVVASCLAFSTARAQSSGQTAPPPDSLLARQLARRVEIDQAARGLWTLAYERNESPSPADVAIVVAIDSLNTAWIKAVIAERGWPTESLVGEQGSTHAWLLVQHSDRDRPFQRAALEAMGQAVAAGEASASDFAYLTDRVRRGMGEPQVYGTQLNVVDGRPEPFEMEAPEAVDARRASVGLPPLAEYIEFFRRNVLGQGDEEGEVEAP